MIVSLQKRGARRNHTSGLSPVYLNQADKAEVCYKKTGRYATDCSPAEGTLKARDPA
jgi:hypothetical protein